MPYTNETLQNQISSLARNIFLMMKSQNIDAVVALDITSAESYLIYIYCKLFDIPYWNLLPLRIGKYLGFSDGPMEEFTKQIISRGGPISDKSIGFARDFIKSVRDGSQLPHDAAQLGKESIIKKRDSKRSGVLWSLNTLRRLGGLLAKERGHIGRVLERPSIRLLAQTFKTRVRRSRFYQYNFDEPPSFEAAEDSVLFAWQSEPETAVSLYNPQLPRQWEIAYLLSTAVPGRVAVYVKDHPRMFGLRTRSFYNDLKCLNPNIHILDPRLKASDLINRFAVVVTLSGTIGIEATVKGVPCLCLGRYPYKTLPGIYEVENIAEVAASIRAALNPGIRFFLNSEEAEKKRLEIFAKIIEYGYSIGWWSSIDDAVDYDYSSEEFRGFCEWFFRELPLLGPDTN